MKYFFPVVPSCWSPAAGAPSSLWSKLQKIRRQLPVAVLDLKQPQWYGPHVTTPISTDKKMGLLFIFSAGR
jgi:hypothetical protein